MTIGKRLGLSDSEDYFHVYLFPIRSLSTVLHNIVVETERYFGLSLTDSFLDFMLCSNVLENCWTNEKFPRVMWVTAQGTVV